MLLRPAKMEDADTLLIWRNHAETRKAFHNSSEIGEQEHFLWMAKAIKNPKLIFYVAEVDGVLVGTVRAAFTDNVWALSWTVSPKARGNEVGKKMVSEFTNQISAPLRAEIKDGNFASIKVAEHAGMKFSRKAGNVLHYFRGSSL